MSSVQLSNTTPVQSSASDLARLRKAQTELHVKRRLTPQDSQHALQRDALDKQIIDLQGRIDEAQLSADDARLQSLREPRKMIAGYGLRLLQAQERLEALQARPEPSDLDIMQLALAERVLSHHRLKLIEAQNAADQLRIDHVMGKTGRGQTLAARSALFAFEAEQQKAREHHDDIRVGACEQRIRELRQLLADPS